MSRVVVIGATAHIGTYLVAGGHEVIAMSRGVRGPYLPNPRWDSVTVITVDRAAVRPCSFYTSGEFGHAIARIQPLRHDPRGGSQADASRRVDR